MIARLVDWSTRHNRMVVGAAVVLALAGEWARRSLSRDAVPDLSDPQVGLFVDWMGHPASEVANRITTVLTDELRNLPGSTAIRGSSMAGMAYVDVVFGALSRLEPGRQEILKRVANMRGKLPPNARIQFGPTASSTGWIFQYALVDSTHRGGIPAGQRVQDELLRPALASIPGVAEVVSVGEPVEEVLVEPDADKLRARGVAFSDVVSAVRAEAHGDPDLQRIESLPLPLPTSTSGGPAAAMATSSDHATRMDTHRTPSSPERPAPQGGGMVPESSHANKAPLRIGDVAHSTVSTDMPLGIADFGGFQWSIGGIVVARRGADPRAVIEDVQRTLDKLRPRLPNHLEIVTVYNRLDLASRVEHTLLRALSEEVAVVVLVILMFLLHGPSALVPLATLPMVLFLTFAGMRLLGIPATIMSLGGIGIALGMAVDADVVALEACHRRIERLGMNSSPGNRRSAIIAAAGSLVPAILTSLVITALSFLPVFAFTGETGRLLRPLAITKTLVIISAALVAVTLAPALRDRLLRGRVLPEFDNPITKRLVQIYRPFVHFALARPALTLITAALAVASCFPILTRLGGEFLPRVDEGDLLFMPTTLPGVSPGDAGIQLRKFDQAIGRFDEVSTVFGKVGRANTATDPAPFSMAEVTIRLKPHAEWPKVYCARWYSGWASRGLLRVLSVFWPEQTTETTAELVEKLDRAVRLPGWTNAWTAPARARMDMMSTGGVRTPVGIRVVAATPARLDALGTALQKWARGLSGTRSAVFESLGGEPWLRFEPDPAALAFHGVDPALAQSTTALLINGGQVGEVSWQNAPFQARHSPRRITPFDHGSHGHSDIEVRGSQPHRLRVVPNMSMKREDADQLRDVTVRSSTGQPVALALLGHPTYVTEPAVLRTESGELVAYVYVDLAPGTDVSTYVGNARPALATAQAKGEVQLQPGERIEWNGQYELMATGERRLKMIVPFVALAMLGLLFLQFRSLTEALIVLVSVPFALVGSFWTLFLLHYPLSAPVWVGLLSAVGLAMQTGVVMVVYIDEAFHRRVREGNIRNRDDIVAAHAEGTVQRLRPKVMTITTMAAGLLPLLWADGSGAEIMKRVAASMLGGLATSAFLTLEVLPVLYTIWRSRQLRQAQTTGVPIEAIVGTVLPYADRRAMKGLAISDGLVES